MDADAESYQRADAFFVVWRRKGRQWVGQRACLAFSTWRASGFTVLLLYIQNLIPMTTHLHHNWYIQPRSCFWPQEICQFPFFCQSWTLCFGMVLIARLGFWTWLRHWGRQTGSSVAKVVVTAEHLCAWPSWRFLTEPEWIESRFGRHCSLEDPKISKEISALCLEIPRFTRTCTDFKVLRREAAPHQAQKLGLKSQKFFCRFSAFFVDLQDEDQEENEYWQYWCSS